MTMSPFAAWLDHADGLAQRAARPRRARVGDARPGRALRAPAAATPDRRGSGAGRRPKMHDGRADAFVSPPFIVLALTFFACCAAHAGPIFHTVSYAMTCGLAPLAAVTVYSVEGLAGLGGRLALGVLADRLGVKRVLIAGLLIQALAAGAFIFASRLGEFYAVAADVRLRLRRRDAALRGARARILRPAHPRRGVRRRRHGVEPRHGARAGPRRLDLRHASAATPGCTSARPRSASAPWRSRSPFRRSPRRQRFLRPLPNLSYTNGDSHEDSARHAFRHPAPRLRRRGEGDRVLQAGVRRDRRGAPARPGRQADARGGPIGDSQ